MSRGQNGARFYAALSFLFALSTVGFWVAKRAVDVGWWPVFAGVLSVLSLVRALTLTSRVEERWQLAVASAGIALVFLGGGAFVLLHPLPVRVSASLEPLRVPRHHFRLERDRAGHGFLLIDHPEGTTTLRAAAWYDEEGRYDRFIEGGGARRDAEALTILSAVVLEEGPVTSVEVP